MGIDVAIENEKREPLRTVYDSKGYLARLISTLQAQCSGETLLRYVDAYGDTVFNQLQIPDVIQDFQILGKLAATDEERQFAKDVSELLEQARDEPHLYVRLIGD